MSTENTKEPNLEVTNKQLDAEIVVGVGVMGILCHNQAAREFIDNHIRSVGQWHNDTFWMKLSRTMDLLQITIDMCKAGLSVE